jgi:hypothetical protein
MKHTRRASTWEWYFVLAAVLYVLSDAYQHGDLRLLVLVGIAGFILRLFYLFFTE